MAWINHRHWRYPENCVSGTSLASLKHEEIYRRTYETAAEAGCHYDYLHCFNEYGFPPAAIRVLFGAREGVPFPVADGIALVVAPDLHASGMPVEPLVERLGDLLQKILEKKYTCTQKRERK